ncbi:MAG: hypothetical protein G01um101416_872 [Microgenomates group bacterium Gr01-1014_16]|nr:MAG: hypothetical protein G01um101416_872 [Microgenomates group bacterium Gr01-1014_16]
MSECGELDPVPLAPHASVLPMNYTPIRLYFTLLQPKIETVISTFKETLTSLRDPKYFEVIAKKTVKQSLWYWGRYVQLFALIPTVLAIFTLTYYTPQFPRLAKQYLPEADLTVKDGLASTSLQQPFVANLEDVVFIIDTTGDSSLNKPGVMITKDKFIFRSPEGDTQTQSLKDLGDFHFDKSAATSWISSHQFQIWLLGFLLIVLLAVIFSLSYVSFNILLFLFWAAIMWLISRLRHRKFLFFTGFKIAVHASVLPLIISALTFISSSQLIFFLNLFLFIFYTVSWYHSLTT